MKGERPDWFPDWQGRYVAAIAGGPSIKRSEVDLLRGRLPVVVINESHQLAPWADALYSCDHLWWELRHHAVKDFAGLKITPDSVAAKKYPDLKKLKFRENKPGLAVEYFLMDEWSEIGSGRNSGFQVINWLAQLQVKGIMLLGYDFCTIGDKLHWHGRHGDRLNNPLPSTFVGWKQWMENAAPKLRALGIEVINTSMYSAIGCFPRVEVAATLVRWKL
jgi:hypothetical protein